MNKIIQENQSQLVELCKKYHAQRLEVFGSVTRDDFNPATSDLDFLVEFDEVGVENYADCYFGLLEELVSLFSLPVELVVISSVKNPYFLQNIEKNRALLYAA
jgi:hypothetical protein